MDEPVTIPIKPAWRRRVTLDEYHQMVAAGVFDEDGHVELLEGELVAMSPQEPPHARLIGWLNRVLVRALDERFVVRPQLPLTLARSEPEPDLAVVTAEQITRARRHPVTALLVIELADSNLRKDRLVKAAVYAEAGVEEYWIVNVAALAVEVHRDPDRQQRRYRRVETVDSGLLTPSSLPGVAIDVSAMFALVAER